MVSKKLTLWQNKKKPYQIRNPLKMKLRGFLLYSNSQTLLLQNFAVYLHFSK